MNIYIEQLYQSLSTVVLSAFISILFTTIYSYYSRCQALEKQVFILNERIRKEHLEYHLRKIEELGYDFKLTRKLKVGGKPGTPQ